MEKSQAKITSDADDFDSTYQELEAAGVPVTKADCRSCSDPCEEGHEDFKFEVDRETRLLGSMNHPYRRKILISTGKSDWAREVTEDSGTLAAFINDVKSQAAATRKSDNGGENQGTTPGVHSHTDSTNISISNASHKTISDDDGRKLETVLVFPEFRIIANVPPTLEGANTLWKEVLDPALEVAHPTGVFESWVLPYSCVVCLCSHKKRDNRCAIAAPKLKTGFTSSLEHRGWQVDTQLDDTYTLGKSLEESLPKSTPEEIKAVIETKLRELPALKRALILTTSHMGGHKFAGNVMIHTPQGSCIMYGRVTPHEVESIVENTIINGQILPSLLRGGMAISRPNCKSLADW